MEVRDVPAELIAAVAMGLEEPNLLALRFGLDEDQWKLLSTWPPFIAAVESKKAEFTKSGLTARLKFAILAEDLWEDVYRLARTDEVTFMQKLEAAKALAKLGDLEPKQTQQTQTGGGFSVTINLPAPGSGPEYKPAILSKDETPVEQMTLSFNAPVDADGVLDLPDLSEVTIDPLVTQ